MHKAGWDPNTEQPLVNVARRSSETGYVHQFGDLGLQLETLAFA
jgi:hypothetical protein